MRVKLKTKNLTITTFNSGFKGIVVPMDIDTTNDSYRNMRFYFDEDFHGIKRDVDLDYQFQISKTDHTKIISVLIPLDQ
jgi:hypothetical protein